MSNSKQNKKSKKKSPVYLPKEIYNSLTEEGKAKQKKRVSEYEKKKKKNDERTQLINRIAKKVAFEVNKVKPSKKRRKAKKRY